MDNTSCQPSTFRTKNWVEINDDSCGTYDTISQIKFKTTMLKSRSCDYRYRDAYIIAQPIIAVAGTRAENAARTANRNIIQAMFKNQAPFIDCKVEINNTQVDNANDCSADVYFNRTKWQLFKNIWKFIAILQR